MKLSNIFTSKWLYIDIRVAVSMILVSFCCLGLLAYRINNNFVCNDIVITLSSLTNHKNHNFFTGELVHFSAPMEGENEVIWNFGDESESIKGGSVTHVYKSEGDFNVEVIVNGRCTGTESLSIKKFIPTSETTADSLNPIIRDLRNPITAETFIVEQGKQLLFWSNMPATAYEWFIIEDKTQLHKTTDKASFNFQKQGNFTLKLILNNDPKTSWTRNITVNPRKELPVGPVNPYTPPLPPIIRPTPPPSPTPTPANPTTKPEPDSNSNRPTPVPPEPKIANPEKDIFQQDEDWIVMLQSIINGSTRLEEFKPYIHDFDSKIVLVNGESMSFVELIGKLKRDKKLDEKSISIQQDYDTKLRKLKRLIVTYKGKKRILGL